MTITSTEERSAQLDQAEEVAPEVAVVAPPAGPGPAPLTMSAADSGWISSEEEEPEPARARTDWMTRFAWAKAIGGW